MSVKRCDGGEGILNALKGTVSSRPEGPVPSNVGDDGGWFRDRDGDI